MAALTLRIPDDKHQRLRALAQSRSTTINRLLDEMTTSMLAEFAAETRFKLRITRGTKPQENRRYSSRRSGGKRPGD
ncbi:MAG TPA: toxin-antitoxin system HicB family antitoxin [Candidatus Accumulibacter sp.]|jgi:predicted transcriptional regulator|uniref:toxin-antitoxin system HicB family antitoxin n=1 Tax=Accumulibacter sp. TaxID=2053492 RepID=UPI000EC41E97|nr:toxin-antitoxin system HicB family antitoxin [Accumulibacter sp.]HCZ15018.1 toxin-antitoxin system HicB family antitoxin [Accumulibacter sp.]HRF11391.1 toxin-antitoxin system HicB family antitoxin [Candidatus Accumulibacter phosphatis]